MICGWRVSIRLFVAAIFPLLLLACSKHEQPGGPVVAKVGTASITVEDLQRELKRRTPQPTAEQREAALQDLIRIEALNVRARETGFDKDPKTQARVRRLIATAYEEKLSGPEKPTTNSVPELEEYYGTHPQEFMIPDRVHLAAILVRVPQKANEEKRAEALARAKEILEQAKAIPATTTNFGSLATLSEDATSRYRGGDIGTFSLKEAEARWTPEIAGAIFTSKPGDLVGPLKSPEGILIFKVLGQKSAAPKPFIEVKEVVAFRVAQSKKTQEQKAIEEKIRNGLKIEINRDLVNSIKVASPSTPTPPTSPAR